MSDFSILHIWSEMISSDLKRTPGLSIHGDLPTGRLLTLFLYKTIKDYTTLELNRKLRFLV